MKRKFKRLTQLPNTCSKSKIDQVTENKSFKNSMIHSVLSSVDSLVLSYNPNISSTSVNM